MLHCVITAVENWFAGMVSQLPSKEVLTIIGLVILLAVGLGVRHLYRRGCVVVIRVIGILYNCFHKIWPAGVFVHSTWTTVVASFIAFILFIPYTDQLIVNVTAVYATILFLQNSLRVKVPLLDIEFNKDAFQDLQEDTNLVDRPDDEYVMKDRIKIKNFGDAAADNLKVEFRAVCLDKGVTRDWSRVKFGDDDSPTLSKDDDTEAEIVLDSFDEYNGEKYYTEVRARPNVRQGHLTRRRLHVSERRESEDT